MLVPNANYVIYLFIVIVSTKPMCDTDLFLIK